MDLAFAEWLPDQERDLPDVGFGVEQRHRGRLEAAGDLIVGDLRERAPRFAVLFIVRIETQHLAAGALGAPAGCGWDLSVAPSFRIEVNAACQAGTFPLDPTEDFTALTRADDAPEYGAFLSTINGAIPSSVGDAGGVFWYNIEGNSRLWPTFNVFLVRDGNAVYKVQITDYYSSAGASGFPTMRFEQLQ